MKNKIIKVLSKPKIVIPTFAILSMVIISLTYSQIGKAPIINIKADTSTPSVTDSNTLNLSFTKSGRVDEVLVKSGQIIHKGEILAKLSAPDAEGMISQAKGALDLAEAELASLNLQYKNAKTQQDLLVKNAYQTLLSSGLEGVPSEQTINTPIISGTYSCDTEGSYIIKPYSSFDNDTGVSFNYSGLESGTASVKYDNPVALGICGLQIKFKNLTYFNPNINWTIDIPNTKSEVYLANKNAYELIMDNREKVLSELATTIGNDNGDISVSKAKVDAAKGAYEAALGSYENNVITAPADGTVSFIDKDLKVGQSVTPNKNVISIILK